MEVAVITEGDETLAGKVDGETAGACRYWDGGIKNFLSNFKNYAKSFLFKYLGRWINIRSLIQRLLGNEVCPISNINLGS